MSWVKYAGKILKVAGKIAVSLACCCDSCCGCEWLLEYNEQDINNPGTGRIRVTFSGAIGGYAILHATLTGQGHCMKWTTVTQADVDNMIDGCDLDPFTEVVFLCAEGDHSASQLQLTTQAGLAGCSIAAWTQVSVSCGPPLSAVYSSYTVESVPGQCPCGPDSPIYATVTNEDPLL